MTIKEIIRKKRDGEHLELEEVKFLIDSYVKDPSISYQISAFLMAAYINGLSYKETAYLTNSMLESGDRYNFTNGIYIDKHSTGGVGDKTSLMIAPLAASFGLKIPMMTGRSLGHTGGTLDKLESIKGYKTNLEQEEIKKIIDETGFAMFGQSKKIVPADKLIYALRDATSTVESVALITSSILSKKVAEGAKNLVLDIKTGSGAFIKKIEETRKLAKYLVETAKEMGIKVVGLLTDMSSPLGEKVGNFLEVEECIFCMDKKNLKKYWSASDIGNRISYFGKCGDVMEITFKLTANMMVLAGIFKEEREAELACIEKMQSGEILEIFYKNAALQGADLKHLEQSLGIYRAPETMEIKAETSGFIKSIDAMKVGLASVHLKVGREKMEDSVDHGAGIILEKKEGDCVKQGETVFRVYASKEEFLKNAEQLLKKSFDITSKQEDVRKFLGVIEYLG